MPKCNLEIDIAKCMSCYNCVVATKDEYSGNEFAGYAEPYAGEDGDLIAIRRHERGSGVNIDVNYVPLMCNHCDDAPCVRSAGGHAIYKRADGITIVDPYKSRGRKDLVQTCPYGAIHWNEEHQVPQIWNFDAHLLDAGYAVPRCVDACPTQALKFHRCSDEEMAVLVKEHDLAPWNASLDTKPRVYYRNLYLVRTHFIGGTVTATRDGRTQNVDGAEVRLSKDGALQRRTRSDDFGCFRLDGISDGATGYTLEIEHAGFRPRTVRLESEITGSVNVDIVLEATA